MTAPVVSSFFPDLPVVLVSHRGPVSFRRDQTGARTASRGAGGLVTALTGLASSLPDAVWVCAAATNEDVAVAREHGSQAVSSPWSRVRESWTRPTMTLRWETSPPG
jgi:trehalose-6-phosphate synthase